MFRPSRSWLFVPIAVGLLGGLGVSLGQVKSPEQQSIFGRAGVTTPDPTENGQWAGTWFYVSKSRKMALWFKAPETAPQVKFRFEEVAGIHESFTTGWDGKAIYGVQGAPGSFIMNIVERNASHISGDWDWWLGDEKGGRHQTADFELYRTGDGRTIVMIVTDTKTEQFRRKDAKSTLAKQVWTFRKATARQARWAELPF